MSRPVSRVATVFVLAAVLFAGIAAPVAGAPGGLARTTADHAESGGADTGVNHATTDDAVESTTAVAGDQIHVDTDLSLTPETPGSFGVFQTFTIPDRVVSLTISVPEKATMNEADGFSKEGERTWKWDGETTSPTLSYAMDANETAEQGGPLAGEGSYLFVDTGDWALVRRPSVGLSWRQRGQQSITISRNLAVDGEGAVGGETAYLGPYEEYTEQAHGQTFRLIVPEAAAMVEEPETVFDSVASASSALQVGDRDETVFMVAAPTTDVSWAVQGLQLGERDFWVRDVQQVDDVENVWVHEYVHTRQSFKTEASAKWLTEATATWYAARYSLKDGEVSFDTFERFLSQGSQGPPSQSVLAQPTTWQNNAQYRKGSLVAGELDRRIRLESEQGASLQTVFRALNDRSEPVSNEDVLDAVETAAGTSTRDAAAKFTATKAAPEMWDRDDHETAFGPVPALMNVEFRTARDMVVTGPYREADLNRPAVVAAGETVAVTVTVQNVGGTAGDYDVPLLVDDEEVDYDTGRLGPNESEQLTLDHRFDTPGTYTLSVAGEKVPITVKAPATPRVTSVSADRGTVQQGSSVQVTATVENTDSVPGTTTVAFTRDGETVTTREVTLGPGESTEVTASVRMPATGTHRVGAGKGSVAIRVTEEAVTSGSGPGDTSLPIPGLGGAPAVVAVLAVAVLLARRLSDA